MEAPRLRLIILGCLRGLVKPGFKFGITSFVREEVLLGALQREIDGHSFLNRGLIESALTGVVIPARRAGIYRRAIEYLMQGSSLLKGGSYKGLKKWQLSSKDEHDIRETAAAFKVLKKTDFYAIMAATLKANTQRR